LKDVNKQFNLAQKGSAKDQKEEPKLSASQRPITTPRSGAKPAAKPVLDLSKTTKAEGPQSARTTGSLREPAPRAPLSARGLATSAPASPAASAAATASGLPPPKPPVPRQHPANTSSGSLSSRAKPAAPTTTKVQNLRTPTKTFQAHKLLSQL